MLETRIDNFDPHPVLSFYDIQIWIATTISDRRSDADEVTRQRPSAASL